MVDAAEGNSNGQNYTKVTYGLYAALVAKMSILSDFVGKNSPHINNHR